MHAAGRQYGRQRFPLDQASLSPFHGFYRNDGHRQPSDARPHWHRRRPSYVNRQKGSDAQSPNRYASETHTVQIAELAVTHPVFHSADRRLQACGKTVEQCRLTGAALADNCQHFTRIQLKGNIAATKTIAVEFRQSVYTQQR
uniref:Transposase n=1 Tax=Parastrongyloides trichosuri TaxID=131310 RepID=A0A0N4Z879_PARTI